MRTVKFRGRRIDGKGWAFGDLLMHPEVGITIVEHSEPLYQHDGVYLGTDVEPNSIGQFTGLKDKNGEEIYEGDILNHEFDAGLLRWLISFSDGSFRLQNIGIDGYMHDKMNINQSSANNRIVVGNITDNPELLTK